MGEPAGECFTPNAISVIESKNAGSKRHARRTTQSKPDFKPPGCCEKLAPASGKCARILGSDPVRSSVGFEVVGDSSDGLRRHGLR